MPRRWTAMLKRPWLATPFWWKRPWKQRQNMTSVWRHGSQRLMYGWHHNNLSVVIWNCIGATGYERYDFRLFTATWRFKIQMDSGIFQWWISPEVKLPSVIPCFSSLMTERFCGALNRLVNDVIIYWSQATRTTANNVFDPFMPCQTSYL